MKPCLKVLQINRNQYYYWRHRVNIPDPDAMLRQTIKDITVSFPFYGFPRVNVLVKQAGFKANHKKIRRIYRELALQMPMKIKRSRKLYEDSFSKNLTQAEFPNHVWAMDFLKSYLSNGRPFRAFLTVDIMPRDIVASRIDFSLPSAEVVSALDEGFDEHGKPMFARSDNGPEFRSKLTGRFLSNERVSREFIEKGKPFQNGFAESLVDKVKEEFFNRYVFDTIEEVREAWAEYVKFFNTKRPHQGLKYKIPQEVRRAATYSLLKRV
jgi:putative transposase